MAASQSIAVVFLARGRHPEWARAAERFVLSYIAKPAGIRHRLYVILKGFENAQHLRAAERRFVKLDYTPLFLPDDGLDIGAYRRAADVIAEDRVCFFNTKTQILASDWLLSLDRNLSEPGIGLVGATGSFERRAGVAHMAAYPAYPNVHIRTNAFLIERTRFQTIAAGFEFRDKFDQSLFESGRRGMTRRVLEDGLGVLVVGADGRGFPPPQWPHSKTYRSPSVSNALIADDTYRRFVGLAPDDRERDINWLWKDFVNPVHGGQIGQLMREWAVPPMAMGTRDQLCACGSEVPFTECHGHRLAANIALGN